MRPPWPLSQKGSGERRACAHRDLARLVDEELTADSPGPDPWADIRAAQEAERQEYIAEWNREVTPLYGDTFDRDDWHLVTP